MGVSILVYWFFVLQSFSTFLCWVATIYVIVNIITIFVDRLSFGTKYGANLKLEEFVVIYEQYISKTSKYYDPKTTYENYTSMQDWKTFLNHYMIKSVAIFAIIVSILSVSPKQLVIAISAPFVLEYVVDVKKDLDENNTTKDLVSIPRKIIESFETVSSYVDYKLKEEVKTKAETKADQKSNPPTDKLMNQDETAKMIQEIVTKVIQDSVIKKSN